MRLGSPSGRPISDHPYGHGKAQHLSALAEAAILAAVAVWIAVEATTRLINGSTAVSATWYAFVLMVIVLVVDAGRSTASLRVGRAEHNAALLANAAHFASDFVGSLAVLVGLILVVVRSAGRRLGGRHLRLGDRACRCRPAGLDQRRCADGSGSDRYRLAGSSGPRFRCRE